MTHDEICLDLILRRPASVSPQRWNDLLLDRCCKRLVPNLRSFSIGDDEGRLSVRVCGDHAGEGVAADLEAVAALYAELQVGK